ncbi:MAG: hypothetical protein K2I08_01150 [Muribaculaceae bacterium]|nr:hypothetical protein [Muribaculaceae bacterium]MDE6523022.1 hypothetical protein [Muribaculaceae bacterium]
MKKLISLATLLFCMAFNAGAITYEEAFDSIKALPRMKGVDRVLISGDNIFQLLGITDGQLIVWDGEKNMETAPYYNEIYKIIGQLPPSEMIKSYMTGITGSILAIFAKPVSENSNRIIILADSSGEGATEAIIGYINDDDLQALQKSILVPRSVGGTSIYMNAINF